MRIQKKPAFLYLIAFTFFSFTSLDTYSQISPRVSFQTFYDELEPYGQWIEDSEYGYVWTPDAEPDFQPYASNGRWVITEFGNTWVSDYPWGWAPFHYGRWNFNNHYGWFWIPDYEWGPAWVNWRSGNGYYGWAPLLPGRNINFSINIPLRHWVFVPHRYISSHRIYNYCVRRPQVVHIYRNTTIINNYYNRNNRRYASGPRPQDIYRATGNRVVLHRIDNINRPGRSSVQHNTVKLYRPDVNQNDRERARPNRITPNSDRVNGIERNNADRISSEKAQSNSEIANSTEKTSVENEDSRRSRPARREDVNRESLKAERLESGKDIQQLKEREQPTTTSQPERPSRPQRSQPNTPRQEQVRERPPQQPQSSSQSDQNNTREQSSKRPESGGRPSRNR